MFYQVGNQTFTSKYLAASCAAQTKQQMHFNLYESTFDLVDWTKEPDLSWDSLLDIRVHQLANKNRPLVLYFSGGTDSYTIYKAFERNNVHLDVIYLRKRKLKKLMDDAMHSQVLNLLNNGVYDPTTKIIVREDDENIFNEAYSDPYWIWTKNLRHEFGHGFNGDNVADEYISKFLNTDNFISINGLEKPKIIIDYNGVFSYQVDKPFMRMMAFPNMESFYITPDLPELHVKQSYMLAKFIRSLHPHKKPKDLKSISMEIVNPLKFDWNIYSAACGRYGDLAASGTVQAIWANEKLLKPATQFNGKECFGLGSDWFASMKDTKTFKNYVDGILSFCSDSAGQYLLKDSENLYSMKDFTSKFYRLNNSVLTTDDYKS